MNLRVDNAVAADIESIVSLLRDDDIGASRELAWEVGRDAYMKAFHDVSASVFTEIVVARISDQIVGCVHLAYIPGLSFGGAMRCLVEDVRVAAGSRRMGIGRALLLEAERRAKLRGCSLMELFVNQERSAALQFYGSLGYAMVHRGFRKQLG